MVVSPGVWIILLGCPCMWNCMKPSAGSARRDCLCCWAVRAFFSSAAHGWNGRPSGNPAPTSKNVATGGVPGGGGGGTALAPPACPRGARSRSRTDSGLPSAVLGVGASRIGSPLAVRGTPGVEMLRPLRRKRRRQSNHDRYKPAAFISLPESLLDAFRHELLSRDIHNGSGEVDEHRRKRSCRRRGFRAASP